MSRLIVHHGLVYPMSQNVSPIYNKCTYIMYTHQKSEIRKQIQSNVIVIIISTR